MYHLLLIAKVFHLKLSQSEVLGCSHGKEKRSGQKGIKNYSLKPESNSQMLPPL